MLVKVIKEFIDREADMTHRKIYEEFEAEEMRAKHLETLNFVKPVETTEPKKPTKKTTNIAKQFTNVKFKNM
jgi:hypothetical protein